MMRAEFVTSATDDGFVEHKLVLRPMTEEERRDVGLFAAMALRGSFGIRVMEPERDGGRSLSTYCPLPRGGEDEG
jgi:hypothetical protein